ncbi:G-patch domain and KOW motifs-containing protein isoform X3 [Cuculus canorus]|uniref:G-patch domain and KOW motifs-containing protein isoform X3 n=1 Tax=Cuculus canorus TaxID=55661 RepID=UPI0023AB2468|nr:G-patch domain and KOW motifs-containing protein isoform X3 [Cuculus canorus]
MAADGGAEAEMAAEAAAAAPPGPVSFSFSRKAERRKVLRAEQSAENGGDTDFLTAVEGRELLSSRPAPPPPQELVIPLQPPRRRRNPDPPEGHAPSPASHAPPGSVEAQAVQELLEEVRQSQEPGEGEGGPPLAIPLRLQEGDVPPRPQPGPQDYEAVPVAAFGLAMLRGMGWSQGEGIGRTFKQVVKPLEHRLRPRGLGLGADPAPPGAPQNRGGEEAGEIWGLEVGATVRIESGPHRGMEGKAPRAAARSSPRTPPRTRESCTPKTRGPPKSSRGAPPPLRDGCAEICACAASTAASAAAASTTARWWWRICCRPTPACAGRTRGTWWKVGRILERDPAQSRVLVQLQHEAGRVVELDYDAVCHYVGRHEDD